MGLKTALYDEHLRRGAKMVDFFGWEMPLHYGSQLAEHHQVRSSAGMFDVSHMAIVDIEGGHAAAFLRYLLANNIDRLKQRGKALYSCMLNERAGIIDDLIVYFVDEGRYRMVVNAATRQGDLAWMRQAGERFQITLIERRDLAMIAVQGPRARERVHQCLEAAVAAEVARLSPFQSAQFVEMFIARTGYTGEDGYEIMTAGVNAIQLWRALADADVHPIGLGARDTLRLEAGLNLYGTDMDQETSPLESGLGWTVAWDPAARDFIGRAALVKQRDEKTHRRFIGLVLADKGVLRHGQEVYIDGLRAGVITSGSFSPTLNRSIAMARVSSSAAVDRCHIDIRGKWVAARIVRLPFVRNGKACVTLD